MCDECGSNVKRETVKEYWLVDSGGDGQKVTRDEKGRLYFDNANGAPYDECDFSLIEGLAVFEGVMLTPPEGAQALYDNTPTYWPHIACDEFYEGTWREGTVADAIACGLIAESVVGPSGATGEPKA
jgi:hypothetical protein